MQFEFVAGRPALDFVATVAARGMVDEEKLTTVADLGVWVTEAGLLDRAPYLRPAGLDRARTLREALFRMVTAMIANRSSDPADRALVNRAARRPLPELRLESNGLHREGDLDAVLAVLARDLLDLHGSVDRESLHWCADDTCTRPFVDRSRGGRRRWCGMKGCGDRAKAAAYRQRQRTQPT